MGRLHVLDAFLKSILLEVGFKMKQTKTLTVIILSTLIIPYAVVVHAGESPKHGHSHLSNPNTEKCIKIFDKRWNVCRDISLSEHSESKANAEIHSCKIHALDKYNDCAGILI
jgi:hypothetical protein